MQRGEQRNYAKVSPTTDVTGRYSRSETDKRNTKMTMFLYQLDKPTLHSGYQSRAVCIAGSSSDNHRLEASISEPDVSRKHPVH